MMVNLKINDSQFPLLLLTEYHLISVIWLSNGGYTYCEADYLLPVLQVVNGLIASGTL